MAIISKERTFTLEKLKRIKSLDIAYIFLVLSLILPFFLFKAAQPQAAFYSELTAVICVTIFLIFACFSIKYFLVFNRLTIYLIAITSYLIFDIFINQPIYSSLQWLYIGSLLLSGLVSIIISSLCHEHGYKKILVTVCYGLMIGALMQDIVVILQALHQDWTEGWISYIPLGKSYSGNIGQRNLLAHYLSWGILANAYLVYGKKLGSTSGWALIIFQAAILGAVNSKTLILYMLAILVLLFIAKICKKQLPKSLFKTIALTVVLVVVFQFITLPIINNLQDNLTSHISSIERLNTSPGDSYRLTEWHKAWLIFLENPWFGNGWGSYAYQSFVISLDPRFTDNLYGHGVFTHTHNIVLNLLAETGLAGTMVILGGLGYLLKPFLYRNWQVEMVFILAMLVITTVHSLLEFPLWYAHFFLVFIILLSILLSTNQSNVKRMEASKTKQHITRLLILFCSLCFLVIALQLYFLSWQMQQYQLGLDNSETHRINTAKRTIEIGKKQPLMTAYSDAQAFRGVIGLSADKLPDEFEQSLYRAAYYWPEKTLSFYYLIKQCDMNGDWIAEDWRYYEQLNNYFPGNLDTYSILLSMTTKCSQVYNVVYRQCQGDYNHKGVAPVCSIKQPKSKAKE